MIWEINPSMYRVDSNDCWIWTLTKPNNSGYGMSKYRGQSTGAHRIAWEESYGPIPEGLRILHICDTQLCVNPKHLRLGTAKDNSQDMVAKGRWNGHCIPHTEEAKAKMRRAKGSK